MLLWLLGVWLVGQWIDSLIVVIVEVAQVFHLGPTMDLVGQSA
jgi:hypothetical protein